MATLADLKLMANKLRRHSITSTTAAGSGHPTSCMSCAEIMSALFFNEMKENDEFLLSKGHAAPILWAAYAEAGFIPVSMLKTLRKIDSDLEGHPTPRMDMIKVATGSLGQGLPAGVGMALAKRLKKSKSRVYVLLGDGESAEGSVWEAANTAAHYNLDNLCAILDINRLGQSRETMHGHHLKIYKDKFKAFGWNAVVIDGHDMKQVLRAFKRFKRSKKPLAIIAKTKKGKGVSAVENKEGWHGKPFPKDMVDNALEEIGPADIKLSSAVHKVPARHKTCRSFSKIRYNIGDKVATRTAFGDAFENLGKTNDNVVTIDGDVNNSSKTQKFFKAFPERSFQSFIAEQNMVGMAMGFSAEGYTPFVSTFAAFLTRAHDLIRMAQYSGANIRFVGSHSGVSIGEDGPSQMGLEDISMFLSMQDSLVLSPSDAVSTQGLMREFTSYKGVAYMRTIRGKTPVLYKNNEKFPIGKFKVLKKSKKDKVLVIGTGVTVHEALKAHKELKKNNRHIRVVDLYSIRPLDKAALIKQAKECNNRVIVVEDHYYNGVAGVIALTLSEAGTAVHSLHVKCLPKSGSPEQLRKKCNIDAAAIVRLVKKL